MNYWSRLCNRWVEVVFGEYYERAITPKVRCFRLLEEVLELCQSEEVTPHEVQTIAAQVYGKPTGHQWHELGGVLVTVASYAASRGFNLEECFLEEFERIMDPEIMQKVRKRNLAGDKIGMKP